LAEVIMRGTDKRSGELFSYVDLERRVRADHPLRAIRETANAALDGVSADFSALYSPVGRPSIPPEMLLRALLLQAFYSIRSERPAGGPAGVRPAVSLVRGPRGG
jgi:transposase